MVEEPPSIRSFRDIKRDKPRDVQLKGEFKPIAALHRAIEKKFVYDPSIGRFTPKNPLGAGAETLDALHDAKDKAEKKDAKPEAEKEEKKAPPKVEVVGRVRWPALFKGRERIAADALRKEIEGPWASPPAPGKEPIVLAVGRAAGSLPQPAYVSLAAA